MLTARKWNLRLLVHTSRLWRLRLQHGYAVFNETTFALPSRHGQQRGFSWQGHGRVLRSRAGVLEIYEQRVVA